MPASLLHVGITVRCPHGGVVSTISPEARVLVSGMPVITPTVGTMVSGCSFVLAGVPHPCLRVQWTAAATRVFVNGQPALVQTSEGLSSQPMGHSRDRWRP